MRPILGCGGVVASSVIFKIGISSRVKGLGFGRTNIANGGDNMLKDLGVALFEAHVVFYFTLRGLG